MDREKVIAELTMLADRTNDNSCEGLKCCKIAEDAIALLNQQENDIHHMGLIIDEYEKELKKQKWISVTERLPKSMINRVLVYVQHEDLNGYIGFGHFEKFKGEEMWYDLENNCQFSKRGYTVTHWMEIPVPPMEGW